MVDRELPAKFSLDPYSGFWDDGFRDDAGCTTDAHAKTMKTVALSDTIKQS